MLPVQRKTHSQTRQGRSHDGLTAVQSAACPNCGDTKLPHRACRNCGYVRPGLSVRAHRTNQEPKGD